MLDLSPESVEERSRRAAAVTVAGEFGEGICGICGSSVYVSGECMCSLAGARVTPGSRPDEVLVEEDPRDRLHHVFYEGHHFQMNRDHLSGWYRVGHTASTDPSAGGDLNGSLRQERYASVSDAVACIRAAVDNAIGRVQQPSTVGASGGVEVDL